MSKYIKIKRGLDIPLSGEASGNVLTDNSTTLFGISPEDFPGHSWKIRVNEGDTVKSGDILFTDKETGRIALVSPVNGTIERINRGERRRIKVVEIRKNHNNDFATFDIKEDVSDIREILQHSGLWAMIRQRPYDIVPMPDSTPRDIFITAFDSAPLAPELSEGLDYATLEKGIDILSKLTEGKVYVAKRAGMPISLGGAEMLELEGPHPAGNTGVQIAAVRPVNKGETVWTLNIRTLHKIGLLFATGKCDWHTTVAITGPAASDPHLVNTLTGASVKSILGDCMPKNPDKVRVISGNVLTGIKVNPHDGFLRYPYHQLTLIEEGADRDEFMGWASMSTKKYSVKRSFPTFLRGLNKAFPFDARIKGGHRAMILSEEYEKVFPFDIYPEYLIKAIMAKDIDKMEKLGIYEVAPEDFALPEFVDTSKLELQKIVKEGLEYMRNELE